RLAVVLVLVAGVSIVRSVVAVGPVLRVTIRSVLGPTVRAVVTVSGAVVIGRERDLSILGLLRAIDRGGIGIADDEAQDIVRSQRAPRRGPCCRCLGAQAIHRPRDAVHAGPGEGPRRVRIAGGTPPVLDPHILVLLHLLLSVAGVRER